jgi:hypothetical protein
VAVLVFAVLLAFLFVAALWTEKLTVTAVGHSWKREIQIENFDVRSGEAWCDQKPGDAYDVSRSSEVRSYREVADGKSCTTRRVDHGDGTYGESKDCKTKYRKEPVYDYKCRFKINRWAPARSVAASGRSLGEAPAWPAVKLARSGESLGSEREGTRTESYAVQFRDKDGKNYSCDFPEAKWRGVAVDSKWSLERVVITGLLDCEKLAAAGAP